MPEEAFNRFMAGILGKSWTLGDWDALNEAPR